MNRIFVIGLILVFPTILYTQTLPDSLVEITFIVSAEHVGATDTIYITGNDQLLGHWHPSLVPLSKKRAGLWQRSFSFPRDKNLEFKFTRGDWDKESIYNPGQIPSNFSLIIKHDTTITIEIPKWRDSDPLLIYTGQVTGNVKYHRRIEGYGLKPRDLVVWLPPEYEKNPSARYPVLYMHDGQNMFDPQTSAIGRDWQLDETADSLINNKLIEPIIIVGIYNTPDRSREYTETDTGRIYMELVVNIIKPLIDKSYRTRPQREYTTTGGSSAGGLISFMLIWEYRDIFSGAACLSPVFKYKSENTDINYVDNIRLAPSHNPVSRVYIDYGTNTPDSRLEPGIIELTHALQEIGYRKNRDFVCIRREGSQHNEVSWAKNATRFLFFLFGSNNTFNK